jgi:putative transposase
MLLTFKTKINLTEEQETLLNSMSEEARTLYNHFLSKLKTQFELDKTFISYYTQQKELKDYKTEFLNYDAKKEILRTLHNNYSSFFTLIKKNKELNPKTPKFRSHKFFFTLSFTQDFIIDKDILKISYSKIRKLEIKLLFFNLIRELSCLRYKTKESDIKQLKIFKKEDKYYASIVYEKKEEEIKPIDPVEILSIDLGKKNLLSVYDVKENKGVVYSSKFLSKNQKFLDRRVDELKSKRDKKVKGSIKWKKLSRKIGKVSSKKKTQVNLVLQKVSKEIANQNKTVLVGELSNLKRNILSEYKNKLNRQMQGNWNLMTFVHLLEYKCRLKGNQVVKVNEAWTSKTCCKCGSVNHDLSLNDRQYICDCGNNVNRDINGAVNIYKNYMGNYSLPLDIDKISVSERFGWCHINQMNRFHN